MTRQLAQYNGPTAQADAEATRDLVSAAYGHPKFARKRNGSPGELLLHRFRVEQSADGTVFATPVPEDVELGIPARSPVSKVDGAQYGKLTSALARAKKQGDWDPDNPASPAAFGLAVAAEAQSKTAYDAQLAKDPNDLPLAAIKAREAVFGTIEPLEMVER